MVTGADRHSDREIHPDEKSWHPPRDPVEDAVENGPADTDERRERQKRDVDPVFALWYGEPP